jgi:hypothetical protein
MKLSEACGLLDVNQSRFFIEVYKHYDWKDDADLIDYLEFITHEPVVWLRGFPRKWKSAPQFQRVRATFHKLLKHTEVMSALGDEKCNMIHDVVWQTFKAHLDTIVAERTGSAVTIEDRNVVEQMSTHDCASSASPYMRVADDVESVRSLRIHRGGGGGAGASAVNWKARFDILAASYSALLSTSLINENDRYRAALQVFLDRLCDGSATF